MERPELCRLLLALVGTRDEAAPGELGAADWEALDSLAEAHRLQGLLYARQRDNPAIPAPVRAGWQAAHRGNAMMALVQRAELGETARLLQAGGIDPLVLKGGWLAWNAYPEAAQRPLRDIDLLLPESRFVEGWNLLCAAGYRAAEAPDLPLAQLLEVDKSPPPLIAPRGTPIELHLHAWFPEGRLEYFSPPPDDAGLFARALRGGDGVLHPSAEDMLGHLVIHALYSHRLDCGPLLLSDVDFLLASGAFDWDAFWSRAMAAGWAEGARLVLDLVARYRASAAVGLAMAPVPPTPPELLATAQELLLQDLDTRSSASFAASGLAGGLASLWPRITRRVSAGEGPAHHRDSAAEGGYLKWAANRLGRTVGDLRRADVRRQSRQLARLNRWLAR
ncbi:MAG: nucleotidyltransferase family protein [Novosphingobium sp.]|uniref:nucleotidyltransferase domain-containing protein n=1 Tax=Novosphingobium sp. TaxID=1874826 RepID=UPI001D3DA2AB|nr:nucleotidyltransferase family protein [Novosphingobium sp.]MCB2057733.1 nucleotidyltransferase family protein [Novosphingobium sp.]MCP5386165.1 nucleotidyltransferase family protein [Novosphingobium sp.]